MGMRRGAVVWGLLGVVAFSLTFPATRLAVLGGLDGGFVGIGRTAVAGVLAALVLRARAEPIPPRRLWPSILWTGLGVVLGFPVFSSMALNHLSVAHASVISGLLPAATAVFAVLIARERPAWPFWAAAAAGFVAVLAFAASRGLGPGDASANALLLLAVLLGGLGYVHGGVLARELGGWRVISWVLVFALPVTLPISLWLAWGRAATVSASVIGWAGFAYVALVSQFLGFFAWYRGLSEGGVARIGQLQLAQPVLSLAWAALLLGEVVSPATVLAALTVLACTLATQRARA